MPEPAGLESGANAGLSWPRQSFRLQRAHSRLTRRGRGAHVMCPFKSGHKQKYLPIQDAPGLFQVDIYSLVPLQRAA